MPQKNKALIIVTSNSTLGDTGRQTGFYYDEMALPYWALMDAGYDVEIASIQGGAAPYDMASYGNDATRAPAVQRFLDNQIAMSKISHTTPISDIKAEAYDAIYLPGGHGTMWDFNNSQLAVIIGKAWENGAIIAAVCHGGAGLIKALRADGLPLVTGLRVNAFTNAEEEAAGLAEVVPFLTETELRKQGGLFEGNSVNYGPYSVRDGRLVTGQNPASAAGVAELMLEALQDQKAESGRT